MLHLPTLRQFRTDISVKNSYADGTSNLRNPFVHRGGLDGARSVNVILWGTCKSLCESSLHLYMSGGTTRYCQTTVNSKARFIALVDRLQQRSTIVCNVHCRPSIRERYELHGIQPYVVFHPLLTVPLSSERGSQANSVKSKGRVPDAKIRCACTVHANIVALSFNFQSLDRSSLSPFEYTRKSASDHLRPAEGR